MYGIIDIGSNSVRLYLTDGGAYGKKFISTTRLAEGLTATGLLRADAMARTAQAVTEFVQQAQGLGCREIAAFATEAVRSAHNGKVFTDAVRARSGVSVEVLDGTAEATIGFLGAYTCGACCIVDIGGASTEIVVGDADGVRFAKSFPVGSVRLKDVCAEDERALDAYIDGVLPKKFDIPSFDRVIGIGGTPGTVVSVAERMEQYDPERVHGYRLTRGAIEAVYQKVRAVPFAARAEIVGLHPKRSGIIVGAARLLTSVLDRLNATELTISERDNLEGYFYLRFGQK